MDFLVSPMTTSPCASSPCMNNGACYVSPYSNTYTCSCNQNYYGARCERKRRSL